MPNYIYVWVKTMKMFWKGNKKLGSDEDNESWREAVKKQWEKEEKEKQEKQKQKRQSRRWRKKGQKKRAKTKFDWLKLKVFLFFKPVLSC